ncbi:hypothetical protein FE257_010374 [Aspergillus nanangensis]|uniref:uracil phosphoribosyltransferase n=1 Tax=Aspergillus nanangensis TaxID=2582783 RepID=A0AAD4GS53_ASPNN|nr:hypothetical protein FE257_010374 [Aspergillus nanangensis]
MDANGTNGHLCTGASSHVTVLDQDRSLLQLMTIIRDVNTGHRDFCSATEKVVTRLISTALNNVPSEECTIQTPIGASYKGLRFTKGVCGVSILRAGTSMEQVLRDTWMGPLTFGKLLIQRDETTSLAQIYYSKLPSRITKDATGGSVIKAVETLKEHGVSEGSIILVNIVSSKKGLDLVCGKYPSLKIVSAAVDMDLTPKNYIHPGLGDFGDRYYGTCE